LPVDVAKAYQEAAVVAVQLGDKDFAAKLFERALQSALLVDKEGERKEALEKLAEVAWSAEVAGKIHFELGDEALSRRYLGGALEKMLEQGLESGSVELTAEVARVLGEEHELVKGQEVVERKRRGGGGGVGGLGGSGSVFAKNEVEEASGSDNLRKLAEGGAL